MAMDPYLDIQIMNLVREGKQQELHKLLDDLHPYDVAQLYKQLDEKYRNTFLRLLTSEQLALFIVELELEEQIVIFNKLPIKKASEVMDLMENDDLANLLDAMGVGKIENFLAQMDNEESRAVQNLMKYPPETAGRIMTDRYVWIRHHFTKKEVIDKLRSFAEIAETINYLYVIDDERKLVGVLSYRDLILADDDQAVEEIMHRRVISVPATMDQEEVARVIERYNFLAVPVVEEDGTLVGIVTVDDIVDVVISEANEDIEKLAATGKAIDFNTAAWTAAVRRLPWLILLLFIGVLSGSIISGFEATLSQVVALAFFMPMIAGMTGNTGTQSLALVVRGLITNDLAKNTVIRLVLREFGVGLIIGAICGLIIAAIAYVWLENPMLGLVVGSSLFITLIIGTIAGTLIPLILHKLDIDPAVASGPLITTINDILSLFIYFGIASLFLNYLT